MEKEFGMTKAAILIGISAERLRYWERQRIISPNYKKQKSKMVRRYTQKDIDVAKEIKHMVDDEGFSLKGAAHRMNRPYKG